jgi:hypothetical protein
MRDRKINNYPMFLSPGFSVSSGGLVAVLPRCTAIVEIDLRLRGNLTVDLLTEK